MKRLFVTFETGYCGMEAHELFEFEDDCTDEEISAELWGAAQEHASTYGIELCPDDDYCDNEGCEFEHSGNTGIDFSFVEYVPELHDRYKAGGGSFND